MVEIIVRTVDKETVSETIVASLDGDHVETPQVDDEIFEFNSLKILINQQEVYRDGQLVPLTSREFHTLVYLMRHPNWVFSAEQIYKAVWQEEDKNCGTSVSTVIGRLRHKLTPNAPKDGYIHTVKGSGYKFVVPK